MTDTYKIRRALLSVSDKTGLVDLAACLTSQEIELVSTGGTSRHLSDSGFVVRDVSDLTGFPEIMGGRVKTLHPVVHGGLLGVRSNDSHVNQMNEHNIPFIDLLVVNLYPFERVVSESDDVSHIIENIDIGGPAMVRAAAKNHRDVCVLVRPADYASFIDELSSTGGISFSTRRRLAQTAFARVSAYDSIVSNWLAEINDISSPPYRTFGGELISSLRYGENPHQSGSFYSTGASRTGLSSAEQIQGKELSYNNLGDLDAAYELVREFLDPCVVIVKHGNPCGVSEAPTLDEAWTKALSSDSVSAFGGIVATNRPVTESVATLMTGLFLEAIICPEVDSSARSIFAKKKDLRILVSALDSPDALTVRSVSGGLLVQGRDSGSVSLDDLRVVTNRSPSDDELSDLLFAFRVAKHVKSNAIVFARDSSTVGIGAGQMSRVDSTRVAVSKCDSGARLAGESESRSIGSAVASDAFFPFADGIDAIASSGATSIIQPGGSVRDDEVIAAADSAGLSMVFTGMRHFRH